MRWDRGANSQTIQEVSIIALDARSCFESVASSKPVDQTVWISAPRFTDVVGIHGESRQAAVAAVNSTAVGVAERAISHQGVVGILYRASAGVVQSMGVTRLAVLANVVSVVVDAVWSGSSSYASVALELGPRTKRAEISVDAVVASCAAFIA